MKNAIILHGMPLKEEYFAPGGNRQTQMHWLGWLKSELIKRDIATETPEMPEPYAPVYERWCSIFEHYSVNRDTMLIGHSCGAGFLIRWLSENKVKVGKVVLVAPWLDLEQRLQTGFFDFITDKNLVERTSGLIIFSSLDDDQEILESVEKIKSTLNGVEVRIFTGHGHFIFETMKTDCFPELLETLVL